MKFIGIVLFFSSIVQAQTGSESGFKTILPGIWKIDKNGEVNVQDYYKPKVEIKVSNGSGYYTHEQNAIFINRTENTKSIIETTRMFGSPSFNVYKLDNNNKILQFSECGLYLNECKHLTPDFCDKLSKIVPDSLLEKAAQCYDLNDAVEKAAKISEEEDQASVAFVRSQVDLIPAKFPRPIVANKKVVSNDEPFYIRTSQVMDRAYYCKKLKESGLFPEVIPASGKNTLKTGVIGQ